MRAISEIALDVVQSWKPMGEDAKPYLHAMLHLHSIRDTYLCEDADTIIVYFLSNATYWRGEDAKRLKQELRDLLGGKA